MLIDLTPPLPRITGDFPTVLVLRITAGDVTQYTPPGMDSRLERIPMNLTAARQHEDCSLFFLLWPFGEPYSKDDDFSGWDFHIHKTDKHHRSHQYYSVVLKHDASGFWLVHFTNNQTATAVEIEIENFNPHMSVLPDETPSWSSAWDRIME